MLHPPLMRGETTRCVANRWFRLELERRRQCLSTTGLPIKIIEIYNIRVTDVLFEVENLQRMGQKGWSQR